MGTNLLFTPTVKNEKESGAKLGDVSSVSKYCSPKPFVNGVLGADCVESLLTETSKRAFVALTPVSYTHLTLPTILRV